MPTIDISHKDLCSLVGKNITLKELQERAILYAKGEVEEVEGDRLKVDIKDTNRPDLWSTEGIAREIAGRFGKPGLPEYKTKKSDVKVIIDPKLKNIRPYTACAVARNLNITPDVLSQMIQLQEKVSLTFGRNRKEVAIGVYDLHKIAPPIRFTTTTPEGIRFVPLESTGEMTPRQILEKHPKGREFAYLLADKREYPIFIDNANEVLSIPPIINSDYTGKVTENTKDVFIECSGFDFKFLLPALNVLVTALADRGAQIETVEIQLPGGKKLVTPDLKPKKTKANLDYINRVSGLELNPAQLKKLLEQARYRVKTKGKNFELLYPAYRQDIMHQRDVIEDVVISYGYNNIEPLIPKIPTTGSLGNKERYSESISEILIGLGLQEIMSYTLTNKGNLFTKMNTKPENTVEIENTVSSNWSVFRTWLLPGLLHFLSRNKHVEYPQKIFEIGDVVLMDPTRETRTRDMRKLSIAISGVSVGYEDISSMLNTLMENLGVKYSLKQCNHNSMIPGRTASIIVNNKQIGFIGEVHPLVLNSWGIEKPVSALEISLEDLSNHNPPLYS